MNDTEHTPTPNNPIIINKFKLWATIIITVSMSVFIIYCINNNKKEKVIKKRAGIEKNIPKKATELDEQAEKNLESKMIRYYNNGNALCVLGTSWVCIDKCYGEKKLEYTLKTVDKKHLVTVNIPKIDDDTYNSASEEIWDDRHEALIKDNKEIVSSLNGRKFNEFKYLEANATDLPFNGKIILKNGIVITIKSLKK